MLKEISPPEDFPCFLTVEDDELQIASEGHYEYLNQTANKLYQSIYGYISQPEHDYFCSSHPQERNCFVVALTMDEWFTRHEFNN